MLHCGAFGQEPFDLGVAPPRSAAAGIKAGLMSRCSRCGESAHYRIWRRYIELHAPPAYDQTRQIPPAFQPVLINGRESRAAEISDFHGLADGKGMRKRLNGKHPAGIEAQQCKGCQSLMVPHRL
jgi:hypothetical protein